MCFVFNFLDPVIDSLCFFPTIGHASKVGAEHFNQIFPEVSVSVSAFSQSPFTLLRQSSTQMHLRSYIVKMKSSFSSKTYCIMLKEGFKV